MPAPSRLIATRSDEGIRLSWTEPEPLLHDRLALTGYIILRSSVEIVDEKLAATSIIVLEEFNASDSEETIWLDDATLDTHRYSYRVLAVYNYVRSSSTGGGLYDFIQEVGQR